MAEEVKRWAEWLKLGGVVYAILAGVLYAVWQGAVMVQSLDSLTIKFATMETRLSAIERKIQDDELSRLRAENERLRAGANSVTVVPVMPGVTQGQRPATQAAPPAQ
jgi:hypothetical protein